MITFRPSLGALLALVFAMPVPGADFHHEVRDEAARPIATRFPREAFLQQASIVATAMAPDGGSVAFLRGDDTSRSVWLLDVATQRERMLLARTDAVRVAWTRDSRWLLVAATDRLSALSPAGKGARLLTELGGPTAREFLDPDPSRAAVLVRERTLDRLGRPAGWRLSRIDVAGAATTLDDDPDRITGYAFADGRLAYVQHVRDSSIVTTRIDAQGRRTDILRCEVLRRCTLWPVVGVGERVFLLGDMGGSLRRLQRLHGDGTLEDVAADPKGEADVADVTARADDGLPAILDFRGNTASSLALDETNRGHLQAIERLLPDRALSFDIGRSRWLVGERSGAMQGTRYHLFDTATGRLTGILADAPRHARDGRPGTWLPESAMARQLPFDWTASDGMRLHGFVRVPPGRDASRLPVVVLVHGGPWGHVDPEEFGAGLSAFLAHRGYVVFEPNFRGSTGFGRDYLLAPNGDFGNGRVQRDIDEGVRALLDERVGDADRVAMVGASFGGYSTLLALTWQADLYKAGIAVVPPADFAWDLTWIGRTREAGVLSRELPYERWMAAMSLDLGDVASMDRLHAQSPLANASRMTRPLLLIAGGEDQRVALRGVLGYAARLHQLGRPVTLVVDPDAGHTDERALAREVTFHLIADGLHRWIGGDEDDAPDGEMVHYIEKSTVLSPSRENRAQCAGFLPTQERRIARFIAAERSPCTARSSPRITPLTSFLRAQEPSALRLLSARK